jgi:hypothetical protein
MESYLANQIEPQGIRAIDKLLRGNPLDKAERSALALYLGVTMSRVPTHRNRVRKLVPDAISIAMAGYREIVHRAMETNADPDQFSQKLLEADHIEAKARSQTPQCIVDQIRSPLPSPVALDAIISMDWRLCESNGPQPFITSDNPFFFTTGIGLGNPESEFFIPLTPTHLLHGSRSQPTRGIPKCAMPQKVVRQVNKIMVIEASNFVFSNSDFSWLPKLLKTREHTTYRPTWQPGT